MSATLQILGIGNAIVDVVAPVDDAFLATHGLSKGSMRLVDAEGARTLYAAMPPGRESSGGSVANTCAVASALGARTGYLGTVAADQLGEVFRHDIEASGVRFPTPPARGGEPTARCLILVTPDGQRTMNTFLGACVGFGEGDLDEAMIAEAQVTYLEGYLFDPPAAQAAFRRAAGVARAAGRQVALSLSDAFCVERHRNDFSAFLEDGVEILFANHAEMTSLLGRDAADDNFTAARACAPVVVLTLGAEGSVVLSGRETVRVAAAPTTVVDTTGAGDAYAAGFLAAYTSGQNLDACGNLGARAAALAIGRFGARPDAAALAKLISAS